MPVLHITSNYDSITNGNTPISDKALLWVLPTNHGGISD